MGTQTETQTETQLTRAAPRAARRAGVSAGHQWRKRRDSNPRSLAGRSLSRCSVGRPWGARVLVSGPAAFTLVQHGGIGLWSALMSGPGPALCPGLQQYLAPQARPRRPGAASTTKTGAGQA